MDKILMVGLGGFAGAVLRYLAGAWALGWGQGRYPLGTLLVNTAGCLLAGALYGFAAGRGLVGSSAWLFLFTGLLGGFTTFSALGVETVGLAESGRGGTAAAFLAANAAFGILAAWLGMALAEGR